MRGRVPSARATASRLVGFTGRRRRRAPSRRRPSRPRRLSCPLPRRDGARRSSACGSSKPPLLEERRAAGDQRVAFDDAFHAEALSVREALRRRQRPSAAAAAAIARATGCSDACSSEPTRCSASSAVDARRDERRPRASSSRSSRCRSCRARSCRRDASTRAPPGPLIRMPSCAPRPVPTSRAVGVARPSAQGHAMISTATAAANANDGAGAGAEPEARASRPRSRSRSGRRPPRRGRPAAGRAPCPTAPRHEPCDLRERRVRRRLWWRARRGSRRR